MDDTTTGNMGTPTPPPTGGDMGNPNPAPTVPPTGVPTPEPTAPPTGGTGDTGMGGGTAPTTA